jgi:hypothetical protein
MVFGAISWARVKLSQVLVTKNHCGLPQTYASLCWHSLMFLLRGEFYAMAG